MKKVRTKTTACTECGPTKIRPGDKFGIVSVHLAPESRSSGQYRFVMCKRCFGKLRKVLPHLGEVIEMAMEPAKLDTPTLTFLGR